MILNRQLEMCLKNGWRRMKLFTLRDGPSNRTDEDIRHLSCGLVFLDIGREIGGKCMLRFRFCCRICAQVRHIPVGWSDFEQPSVGSSTLPQP